MTRPVITPTWRATRQPDGRPSREIAISDDPSWHLFDHVVRELPDALGGQWTVQLDGLDERWWDLTITGATVTVHLQHYTGSMVLPAGLADAEPGAVELLDQVLQVLTRQDELQVG